LEAKTKLNTSSFKLCLFIEGCFMAVKKVLLTLLSLTLCHSVAEAQTASFRLARASSKSAICTNQKKISFDESARFRRKVKSSDGITSTFKVKNGSLRERARLGNDLACTFVYKKVKNT
jgi:hypothetical protein